MVYYVVGVVLVNDIPHMSNTVGTVRYMIRYNDFSLFAPGTVHVFFPLLYGGICFVSLSGTVRGSQERGIRWAV